MEVQLDEDLIQIILAQTEMVLGHYVTENGAMEFDAPAQIIAEKNPYNHGHFRPDSGSLGFVAYRYRIRVM